MADYIHGFGAEEEQRLRDQAHVLAPVVFDDLDLPTHGLLLELGCGVGAELEIVHERRPDLTLVGVDLSGSHITAAHEHVECARVVHADATCLPFTDASFDVVLTVWLLEHVPDPVAVLAEARRVLRPDGTLICTEVDNDTFRFVPSVPVVEQWWDRFNHHQQEAGGDPFVGRRLERIADLLGFHDVVTRDLAVVTTADRPHERQILQDYVRDLLLSGAESMRAVGLATDHDVAQLEGAFADLAPDVEFEYHAVQLVARR